MKQLSNPWEAAANSLHFSLIAHASFSATWLTISQKKTIQLQSLPTREDLRRRRLRAVR
jgi:hypothetical protein